MKFDQFEGAERGGLLFEDYKLMHVLQHIAFGINFYSSNRDNRVHHQFVDASYLAALNRLKETGLIRKEDIREHNLIGNLCSGDAP